MANKRREIKPTQLYIPVYIPVDGGAGDLELGKASVRGETLIVEFNTKLPSMAILRRIERGDIVGLTFVIPDDEAEAAEVAEQERKERELTQHEKDIRDVELLRSDDTNLDDLIGEPSD